MEDLEREEWRQIAENPLYEVSNMGRVRVKERTRNCGKNGKSKRTYPAQIMATFLHDNGQGNKNVVVQMRDGKKQVRRSVPKLVLLAFVGLPHGMAKQPKHLNGNALDNRLQNLEWDVAASKINCINLEARELFNRYAYAFIKSFIKRSNLSTFLKKLIFYSKDDFIQDCAMRIWNVIDLYDKSHCKFITFVFNICRYKQKTLLKKYLRRERIAKIINIESEFIDENMPIDYCRALSYEEKFYG